MCHLQHTAHTVREERQVRGLHCNYNYIIDKCFSLSSGCYSDWDELFLHDEKRPLLHCKSFVILRYFIISTHSVKCFVPVPLGCDFSAVL